MVEVVQEGMSYPQPNEKEPQEAVIKLMSELNGMVDQASQTPPQPTLEIFKSQGFCPSHEG